jgi:hypothetical protein
MTMPAIIIWALALLISAVGLVVTVNSHRFASSVTDDARVLWAVAPAREPLQRTPAASLPAPVRRYLREAGVEGHAAIRSARLRHGGTMTPAPDVKPMPIRGRQYFTADPPGFVWWGRARLAPGAWIDARDKVIAGTGGMKVVLESTKLLHDVTGPELDQSALARMLAEIVWLPTTFLDPRYVTWEPVDDSRARARLRVNGREVEAMFEFGTDGMPTRVTAHRYRALGGGKSALTPFFGVMRDWRDVEGVRVPFEIEAGWVIDGKPFTFARFLLDSLEFDRPGPFRS